MDAMSVLFAVWAVLTTVLLVLLIYRYVLSLHEDDQIFLDSAESHLEQEQMELAARLNKMRPIVNTLGASSGVLALVMIGIWMWRAWNRA
jgi:hypothetical protein